MQVQGSLRDARGVCKDGRSCRPRLSAFLSSTVVACWRRLRSEQSCAQNLSRCSQPRCAKRLRKSALSTAMRLDAFICVSHATQSCAAVSAILMQPKGMDRRERDRKKHRTVAFARKDKMETQSGGLDDEIEDDSGEQLSKNLKKATWLGKKHSVESKQKIAAANKGRVPWNKGKQHSEETKRKIAERTRAAMATTSVRRKLADNATGKKHTAATKRKIAVNSREAVRLKNETALRNSSNTEVERPSTAVDPIKGGRVTEVPKGFVPPSLLHESNAHSTQKQKRSVAAKTSIPFEWAPSELGRIVANVKRLWSDSQLRENFEQSIDGGKGQRLQRQGSARMSPESKAKLSQRIKELWSDPNYRARVKRGIDAKIARERELAQLDPSRNRNKRLSSTHRDKISQSLKKHWRDGNRQARTVSASTRERRAGARKGSSRVAKTPSGSSAEASRDIIRVDDVDERLVESLQASGFLPPLRDVSEGGNDDSELSAFRASVFPVELDLKELNLSDVEIDEAEHHSVPQSKVKDKYAANKGALDVLDFDLSDTLDAEWDSAEVLKPDAPMQLPSREIDAVENSTDGEIDEFTLSVPELKDEKVDFELDSDLDASDMDVDEDEDGDIKGSGSSDSDDPFSLGSDWDSDEWETVNESEYDTEDEVNDVVADLRRIYLSREVAKRAVKRVLDSSGEEHDPGKDDPDSEFSSSGSHG